MFPAACKPSKPMESSSSSSRKSGFFWSKIQFQWLHHQKQDSCCFVHKNPRWRTSPSSACSIIPFGSILILLMFVKHCERQEFNSSHLKLDISLYFQLGTFPTSWECSLHTKAAHLRTNPLLRKAASFPGAPADCISSAAVLETHLDITVNISAGRKQSKQNSSLSAVRQGLDASIYLELLWFCNAGNR